MIETFWTWRTKEEVPVYPRSAQRGHKGGVPSKPGTLHVRDAWWFVSRAEAMKSRPINTELVKIVFGGDAEIIAAGKHEDRLTRVDL